MRRRSLDWLKRSKRTHQPLPDQAIQSEPLVTIRGGGRGIPLFCISGAGGNAFTFHTVGQLIKRDRSVYGVQYEGIETRSFTAEKVEEMAADFIKIVRGVQSTGPYFLAGYSMGGVFAYEMARQLAEAGQRIGAVILFDSFAPGTLRQRSRVHRSMLYARRLSRLGFKDLVQYVRERLWRFSVHRKPSATRKSLRDLSPEAWELVRTVRLARAAMSRAQSKYRPKPYLGTVTLFRSSVRSDWEAFFEPTTDNGWGELAKAVEKRPVPGSHATMFDDAHVATVARELDDCLSANAAN